MGFIWGYLTEDRICRVAAYLNMAVERVAHLMGLKREEVLSPGKYKKVVEARSVVCYWAVRELGISQGVLAQKFGISQPAISMAVKRGAQVVEFHDFSLLNR
ncbi:MAG: hypothetical protein ABII68_08035 [Pseudomonadota bacterium]